jgi:OOP family OmpA-OmpF porin
MNNNAHVNKMFAVSALALAMTGCASQGQNPNLLCTAAGAIVGGAGTAAVVDVTGAALAGAAVGALLGAIACPEAAPAPAPAVAAAPAPEPAPAPDPDSDGDGVKDSMDKCPGTPPGKKVDANGCPEILLTLNGVNFKFNSAKLEPESEKILDQAVGALNQASSVNVRVEGHTDSIGSDAYNMKLSQKRADAVKGYLVGKGIAASRMSTAGRGEGQPVASNDTDQGRYMNRRVEFHVEGAAGSRRMGSGTESWRNLD